MSTPFDVVRGFQCAQMTLKLVRIANLKNLAEKRGLSGPVELGALIGRKANQTHDLLNGRASFGEKVARSIEEYASLPLGWLDKDPDGYHQPTDSVRPQTPLAADELIIGQYRAGGGMGAGVILRDQPGSIQSWHVTSEWVAQNVHGVTSPQNLAIVTGFGDSMRPLYNPGDPLLVDTGIKSIEFDGIYFFRVGDEGFIKRVQRIPGVGLRAISDNKAYEPWDIKDGMDFEVFARVLKAWRGEDF